MTVQESIKEIKGYLKVNNVKENDFSEIVFVSDIVTNNHKDILQLAYEEEVFTLFTEDGDFICELPVKEMIKLFPQIEPLVYCSMCDGKGWYDNDPHDMDRIECEHPNLIYR